MRLLSWPSIAIKLSGCSLERLNGLQLMLSVVAMDEASDVSLMSFVRWHGIACAKQAMSRLIAEFVRWLCPSHSDIPLSQYLAVPSPWPT